MGESSRSSPAGGPSLVYYRKYLEMSDNEDTMHTGVKLSRPAEGEAVMGKVLFRVVCEKPCWSTESRRYEAPLKIGIGRAGPIVYEVRPTPPKEARKKQSHWTLYRKGADLQTRARTEDLEGTLISFLSPWKGVPFQVYASSDTKIKMGRSDMPSDLAE